MGTCASGSGNASGSRGWGFRAAAGVHYHCVDGYYAKKKYIDATISLDLHAITKLRSDADCWFLYTGPHPKRKGARRKYDGKVNWQDLRRFDALGTLAEATHVQESREMLGIIVIRRINSPFLTHKIATPQPGMGHHSI